MSTGIKFYYNNVDLFSGIGPAPFVSFDQDIIDFNNKWNQITRLTLEGQLTGRFVGNLSNRELNKSFNELLFRLRNNYGNFVIKQDSDTLFSGNSVVINSINVSDDRWYGLLNYNIEINIYETGLYTEYFGIINPEEKIEYQENNGEIINLTHSISAQGLKTQNQSPLQNAKNWVLDRTGKYDKILPILVKTGDGSDFLLSSTSEQVDRFNGVYSWQADYIKSSSKESPKNSLLSYSIDTSSGFQDNFIQVNINGSFTNNNLNQLRNAYSGFNFYNIANDSAKSIFNINLNSNPIEQSIQESNTKNTLNFNIVYNNDFSSNIINDYTVQINTDNIKNITNVDFSSRISAKYGDVSKRWVEVKDFYDTKFFPFYLAELEYKKQINNRKLFSTPVTESITFNEYNAEINYNAQWTDKRKPFSENVLTMSSTVTYTPSVNIHVPNTSAFFAREHNIQNLLCANRSKLNINVSAVSKPDKNISAAKTEVDTEINRIISNYIGYSSSDRKILRESRSQKIDEAQKSINITEVWSFNGPIILN